MQAKTDELERSWDSYRWDGVSSDYSLPPDRPVTHEPVLPVRNNHPVQVRQRIYGLESLDDLACAQTEF